MFADRLVWYFSSGEVMGTHVEVHSGWIAELKLEAYNWYLEFGESCRWQRQT